MSDDLSSGKRTRASGEVLDYLLKEFENNHNPSPEQRKEISDKTNMTEKAVRIWFQNRRAKVRKSERMGRSSASNVHSRSSSLIRDSKNYEYPSNFDINEKYCFIDCSSLSVGSWQRVKSGFIEDDKLRNELVNLSPFTLVKVMETVDLLVILLKKNLEINYFFSAVSNNSKILFRIFYPLTNILTCSLLDNNIDKENSELRVSLSHQPKFSVNFFNGELRSSNQWSICDDFSEGQQVSSAHSDGGTSIPHVLVGIQQSICALNDFILEKIQQHQNDYMVNDNVSKFNATPDLNDQIVDSNYNSDEDMDNLPLDNELKLDDHLPNLGDTTIWNEHPHLNNQLSPIGQFNSDTSPTSLSSDKMQKKNELQPNFHYNEMFSANTPDFLNSSHTPNIVQNIEPTEATIDQSPYHEIPPTENYDGITQDQFDFPVVNEYSGLDHSVRSPNGHVDSFIDYNNGYP